MSATTTTKPVVAKAAPVVAATVASKPAAPVQYIALLVSANPKKVGSKSHPRFALYVHGQTVAAYAAASLAAGNPSGHARKDLVWDQRHGFVSLHPTAQAADDARAAAIAKAKSAQAQVAKSA